MLQMLFLVIIVLVLIAYTRKQKKKIARQALLHDYDHMQIVN